MGHSVMKICIYVQEELIRELIYYEDGAYIFFWFCTYR